MRLDEAHHYDLEVHGGEVSLIARIGPLRQSVSRASVPPGPLTLTVQIRTTEILPPTLTRSGQAEARPPGVGAHGPDMISFSAGTASGNVLLAELDGRYLSTEVAAGFTGRVIGMYVTEGVAAFDWFDYEGR